MLGDLPVIRKFGIISSGCETLNNSSSIDHLKKGNYPFIQVMGKVAGMVNPFLILNISDRELKELSNNLGLKSFISARVKDISKIEFSLMDINCKEISKAEAIYIEDDPELSYLNMSGSDFVIPFFDLRWNEPVSYCRTDDQLRLLNSNDIVLQSNLFNPNRISYQSGELYFLPGLEDRIGKIMDINRRYEDNGADAFEYGGFSNWGKRGSFLNSFRDIQAKLIELN